MPTERTAQFTVEVPPMTWTAALGLLIATLRDGTEQGRREATEHLRKMAEVADMLPPTLQALKGLHATLENEGTGGYLFLIQLAWCARGQRPFRGGRVHA